MKPVSTPWCHSVVLRVVVAEVLGVILTLLKVLLESKRHWQLHDVVAPYALEDAESTDVLQGVNHLEARHGKEELDGSGWETGSTRSKEVEEASAAGVRHSLFDELDDR